MARDVLDDTDAFLLRVEETLRTSSLTLATRIEKVLESATPGMQGIGGEGYNIAHAIAAEEGFNLAPDSAWCDCDKNDLGDRECWCLTRLDVGSAWASPLLRLERDYENNRDVVLNPPDGIDTLARQGYQVAGVSTELLRKKMLGATSATERANLWNWFVPMV